MPAVLGKLLAPLTSRSTLLRWIYLVLGGALLSPYFVAGTAVAELLRDFVVLPLPQGWTLATLSVLFAIGTLLLTTLIPALGVLETTAVRTLLGIQVTDLSSGPRSPWARLRIAGWLMIHLITGFGVSLLTLIIPVFLVGAFTLPFSRYSTYFILDVIPLSGGPDKWWAPLAALGVALVAVYLVAGVGEIMARLAGFFLGPTPAERLAELERKAERLAQRNRLARELHDSVGHALSVVTIQAAAAGRVLDTDREFARTALGAIEEAARSALADLDHVLGILREESRGSTAPQPTLADLDGLLRSTRLAGVEIDARLEPDLDRVPKAVSREAYRIVQEGLTNAMRHAGKVPVTLRLLVRADNLELEMTNPLGERPSGRGHGGGRGLRGIGERVTVLRGTLTAGECEGVWRVAATLPMRAATS
ncbi:sensor histidine kinase [Crossiella cryophila]|uniref:histidine kinase n=1 Tax=Crossiella cryophila TaxID=43355 RepID=A0A7W7C9J1_9PSEU|nr:histidine kinase [Crossiella cryophila]MBB4676907.1 signal transduction histidine kinase [Crossiella cryophila]